MDGLARFGGFELDFQSGELRNRGIRLRLRQQSIAILTLLVERSGQVVTREEIRDRLWADGTIVEFEHSVNSAVNRLRQALGDSPTCPRFIETLPRHGYRFLVPVEMVQRPAPCNRTAEPLVPREVPPAHLRRQFASNRRWTAVIVGAAVIAGISVARRSRSEDHRGTGVRYLQRITRSESLDISPSFSPDGSAVVYASNRSGSFEIYIRSLTPAGHEIPLTHDGAQNVQPAWSPDGRYVAYHSMARRGIFRLPALGGEPLRLTSFGSQPAWSPDSQRIVFRSQAATTLEDTAMMPDVPSTIWMVQADGGAPQGPVVSGRDLGEQFTTPQFSRDGTRIAFLHGRRRDLWSADVRTGIASRIDCPLNLSANPQYAPDGKSIFAGGSAPSGERGIWRVPIDAAGRAAGLPVQVTLTGSELPGHLALSADGRRLVYESLSEKSTLQVLPMSKDSGLRSGSPAPFTPAYALRNTLPAFSPDGSRLAWFVTYQGSGGQIWLADSDGHNAAPLVTGLEAAVAPKWSVDGRSIRYVAGYRNGQVWSVGLDDRSPRKIGDVALPGSYGDLSPDGKEVVYWKKTAGVANIWKAPCNGEPPKQLTFERESVTFPSWSPDGKWIGVTLVRGDEKQTGVIPAEGGPVTQLTGGPRTNAFSGWSPDSSAVLYAAIHQGFWNLYMVSLTSLEIRQIAAIRSSGGWVRTPAWSPGRDRIVYEQMDMKGSLFVLDLKDPSDR